MIVHLLCALLNRNLCSRCLMREARRIYEEGNEYLDSLRHAATFRPPSP